MHCPRCGQQQISDKTKYCSRCGFQLALVAELLHHGGILPQLAELYSRKRPLFTRKNGVTFGIIWFITFVMMLPAFFGLADFEEGAAVSAVFGVFSTLILVISSLAFLPRSQKLPAMPLLESPGTASSLHGSAHAGTLPPQQTYPASTYAPPGGGWRGAETGEFAHPGSVTDHTTKLLEKDRS
jgi:hypothetical protein